MLNCVLQCGQNWEVVSENLKEYQVSPDEVKQLFYLIYRNVHIDVMSFFLHRLETPEIIELKKEPMFRPIIQMLERGPFSDIFDQKETDAIIRILGEYRTPLKPNKEPDWLEFHALTTITTKTTNQIKSYAERIIEAAMNAVEGMPIIIDPRLKPFEPENVKYFMNRICIFNEVRNILIDGIKMYRPQASLPEGWDISCDIALLSGICQFGFSSFRKLYLAIPIPEDQEHYDFIMKRDLHEFAEFISVPKLDFQRLMFIIQNNKSSQRHVHFYNEANKLRITSSKDDTIKIHPKLPKIDPVKRAMILGVSVEQLPQIEAQIQQQKMQLQQQIQQQQQILRAKEQQQQQQQVAPRNPGRPRKNKTADGYGQTKVKKETGPKSLTKEGRPKGRPPKNPTLSAQDKAFMMQIMQQQQKQKQPQQPQPQNQQQKQPFSIFPSSSQQQQIPISSTNSSSGISFLSTSSPPSSGSIAKATISHSIFGDDLQELAKNLPQTFDSLSSNSQDQQQQQQPINLAALPKHFQWILHQVQLRILLLLHRHQQHHRHQFSVVH